MGKIMNMTFASSLSSLTEINSSFDTGVLRICYSGENRNHSYISKETIQNSLPTIYNCPIVCNYDRDSDTIGGHDIDLVQDDDGNIDIVNLTQPVGVIPESANVWFEDYTEEDGTVNEYLYADVLLWKRQEAYRKIKNDGITAQSMEINVKDGNMVDGVYHIDDFEFTAFALIGEEPCFESAAIEVFSKKDFEQQFSEMMQDLKQSLSDSIKFTVDSSSTSSKDTTDIDSSNTLYAEGGNAVLGNKEDFALGENIQHELRNELSRIRIHRDWGESNKYYFVDYDLEKGEVYCEDAEDHWNLYGFKFEMDGDAVKIDFSTKRRMKYEIVEFEDGEQSEESEAPMIEEELEEMGELILEGIDAKNEFQKAEETISSLNEELESLKSYKLEKENEEAQNAREEIFAKFEDLKDEEAFQSLQANCLDFDLDTLEEKCYAIRGKMNSSTNFSLDEKATKLKIDKSNNKANDAPYGGLFDEYHVGESI